MSRTRKRSGKAPPIQEKAASPSEARTQGAGNGGPGAAGRRNGRARGAVNGMGGAIKGSWVSEALRADGPTFHEMIDSLPAAIYTTDAEGRLTHFNPAVVEFSGRTPDLGSDRWCVSWKLYYPDGTPMPHDQCPMAIALKEGRAVRGEEAIAERPYGKRIWFMPYPTPLIDAAGRVVGGINMLVDITERKEAEQFKARLAAIVESSQDAIASKDLNGVVRSWNRGAEQIFGYTAEEAVGRRITFIIPPDRLDEERVILERIRRGEKIEHYETVRVRKDGKVLPVSLTVSPVKDDAGRIVGASKIARDITERKLAEERMAASLREKEILIKEIHHRVKNNLQIIYSLLGMQSDTITDTRARVKFKESRERVLSIALIHEKLYQTRNLGEIDMAGYIQSLVNSLASSYNVNPEQVGVKVEVDQESRMELDMAIPCGLILNELITNAIKHAFPGGRKGTIHVEFRREVPRGYRLAVADDGAGLPPGLDPQTSESLGLQLVKELADQLHGEIELERDGGTAFRIRFAGAGERVG